MSDHHPPAGGRQDETGVGPHIVVFAAGTRLAGPSCVLPWIAAAWLSGLFIGAQWQFSAGPVLAGLAFAGALVIAVQGHELSARLWGAPLSCLAFCCGLGVAHATPAPCSVRGDAQLTARVESVRHGFGDARLRLRAIDGRLTESGQAVPAGLELTAKLESASAPPPGSLIAVHAELRPRTELRNPSPHPNLSPPRGVGCWARWSEPRSIEVLEASAWASAIEQARAGVRGHMNETLPQEVAGVARALVLGDGGALGYEQRQTIAAVGLAHLFAVSGLHVALVSGTLVRSLHWLIRGLALGFDARRLAAALGIPLTLLHALFAGGSPSAWRAAITAALTWGLVVIGKRPSATAVTAAAALILSAPDPAIALRPAFLLSIVATSAILSAPRVSGSQRWRRLRASATISARTLVATMPLVWWWFGGVPVIGWLTNILVLPFGSLVVIPLAHLFALTPSVPAAAEAVGAALTVAVHVLLSLCDAFAPLAVTRRLPPLDVTQGLLVLVACLLLLIARTWRSRLAILILSSLLWLGADRALIAREQPSGLLRVSFIDVGQGDATLIDFPNGQLALVDTGQGGRHPAARELRGLLAARRRSRIDLVVITHGHPDHYGGLPNLVGEIEIGELWLNGQLLTEEEDGAMASLISSAMARGTRVRFAPELCGRNPRFGGANLEVLWPCPRYDAALDLNDNSIAIRLAFGQHSFLLTGDLERESEGLLLAAGRIRPADVLKVGHHGSRTSTSQPFLLAVRPSLAVISSGAGNRYGHPSPEVVARLRQARARVLRTDLHGGVIITTDGERLEIRR
ncbi:MAG: DNA internalization-related competence protein ComEC/Rec2 [Deltaproteobacteria bacterium]|nr:DNA internalization-related competence protein ComEC/Rec2 [Deltaproteobacteria bacterium]